MKKLFSTLLSITMLAALLIPMNVAAADEPYKASGDIVLEVEDGSWPEVNVGDAAIGTNANCSSGKMFWHWGFNPSDTTLTTFTITMTLNVATAGYYNTEFVATQGNGQWTGIATVKVGDTEIGKSNTAGAELLGNADTNGNYKLYKYIGKKIYLEAGQHTVTISSDKPSSQSTYGFAADYVSFTRDVRDISDSSESAIKFVDFADNYTNKAKDQNEKYMVGTEWGSATDYQIKIPVYAPTTGVYDIEYMVSSTTCGAGTISTITLSLDDDQIGSNAKTTSDSDAVYTPSVSYLKVRMVKYTTRCVVTAGEHLITLNVTPSSGNVKFAADYVKFTQIDNTQMVEQISAPGGYTAKIVDYSTKYKTDSNFKDDLQNQIVGTNTAPASDGAHRIKIPVYASESGVYAIEYLVSQQNSIYYSAVNVSLDGVLLGTNAASEGTTAYTVDLAYDLTMKKYTTSCSIDAGVHELTLDIPISENGYVFFAADSVTFTKLNDSATVGTTGTTVVGYYDTPVTGLAIAALYNGDELINIETQEVTNASKVEIVVPAETAPTKVKMFIWSDLDDVTPLVVSKDITNIIK